jgi:hypothetical protein
LGRSPHNVALARLVAQSLVLIEECWGKRWTEDDSRAVRHAARGAINRALDSYLGQRLGLLAPTEERELRDHAEDLGAYAVEIKKRQNAAEDFRKEIVQLLAFAETLKGIAMSAAAAGTKSRRVPSN